MRPRQLDFAAEDEDDRRGDDAEENNIRSAQPNRDKEEEPVTRIQLEAAAGTDGEALTSAKPSGASPPAVTAAHHSALNSRTALTMQASASPVKQSPSPTQTDTVSLPRAAAAATGAAMTSSGTVSASASASHSSPQSPPILPPSSISLTLSQDLLSPHQLLHSNATSAPSSSDRSLLDIFCPPSRVTLQGGAKREGLLPANAALTVNDLLRAEHRLLQQSLKQQQQWPERQVGLLPQQQAGEMTSLPRLGLEPCNGAVGLLPAPVGAAGGAAELASLHLQLPAQGEGRRSGLLQLQGGVAGMLSGVGRSTPATAATADAAAVSAAAPAGAVPAAAAAAAGGGSRKRGREESAKRQRPRDRQLIQDRMRDLRGLVPQSDKVRGGRQRCRESASPLVQPLCGWDAPPVSGWGVVSVHGGMCGAVK